ncbi:MAG: hypothetical protein ABS873_02540 [Alkalibacterium sp.]
MKEQSKFLRHPLGTLLIVLTGKEKIITLTVDENDIVTNADGELDCPLETTFRRNQITAGDIEEWEIETIQLIEMTKEQENVLYEFDADTVVNLLLV